MTEFNLEDWPDDGTDWDGVHDKVMKVILDNRDKLDKITKFAMNLVYANPHISWQLKQLLKDEPQNHTKTL